MLSATVLSGFCSDEVAQSCGLPLSARSWAELALDTRTRGNATKRVGGCAFEKGCTRLSIMLALNLLVGWTVDPKHSWCDGWSIEVREQSKTELINTLQTKAKTGILGQEDFRSLDFGSDLSGIDLGGAQLSAIMLRSLNLHRANLQGTCLHGANLRWSDLREAVLVDADLREALLDGTDLSKANLCGANLSLASLSGATMCKAVLDGADLHRADLGEAFLGSSELDGADLREATLRKATLRVTDLSGTDLRKADLSETDARGVILGSFSRAGANLRGARLDGADLAGASLIRADLTDASLCGANLKGARYDSSTIWPQSFDPQEAGAINVEGQESPKREPDNLPLAKLYVKTSGSAWGVVLKVGDAVHELSGKGRGTAFTAAIQAVTEGLRELTQPHHVDVHSDIEYLIKSASVYRGKWIARGWLKGDGMPPANVELWQTLTLVEHPHEVEWHLDLDGFDLMMHQAGRLAKRANATITLPEIEAHIQALRDRFGKSGGQRS